MNYPLIRFDKNHIPIHPKVLISTQEDYDYHMASLQWLYQQIQWGFKPSWMITLHYSHPVELSWQVKETRRPLGHGERVGFGTRHCIWDEVPAYRHWEKRRNDRLEVESDSRHIRNLILKRLFGVKRLDRTDKYKVPNIIVFHEKGKAKLQYHTHILLPSIEGVKVHHDLKTIFNEYMRKYCKAISRWKKIDVKPVDTRSHGIMGYLNKETAGDHVSIDFTSSIPLTQAQA